MRDGANNSKDRMAMQAATLSWSSSYCGMNAHAERMQFIAVLP